GGDGQRRLVLGGHDQADVVEVAPLRRVVEAGDEVDDRALVDAQRGEEQLALAPGLHALAGQAGEAAVPGEAALDVVDDEHDVVESEGGRHVRHPSNLQPTDHLPGGGDKTH